MDEVFEPQKHVQTDINIQDILKQKLFYFNQIAFNSAFSLNTTQLISFMPTSNTVINFFDIFSDAK